MTDDSQPPIHFPQYPPANPNGVPLLPHPKQQGILNKVVSRALTAKLARHPKMGIKTNQTVHFGHRKNNNKWKRQLPYY